MIRNVFTLAVLALGMAASQRAAGITLFQVDTFQDGTVQFWGGGANPTNIANGGPLGAGDRFLQISSDGSPFQGGKLAVFNNGQWAGNYTTAGVKVIQADVRNLGSTEISLRAVLFGFLGSRYTSQTANTFTLPAGGGWTRVTYFLVPSDFVLVAGTETFPMVMENMERFMFRHDPGAPSSNGQSVVAVLGIDNVRALDALYVSPHLVQLVEGFLLGGTTNSLVNSDDDRYLILNDESVPNASVRITGTGIPRSYSSIVIRTETRSARNDQTVFVRARNYVSGQYVGVDAFTATLTDFVRNTTISVNVPNYVRNTGEVSVELAFVPFADIDAADGWSNGIDQVQWRLVP